MECVSHIRWQWSELSASSLGYINIFQVYHCCTFVKSILAHALISRSHSESVIGQPRDRDLRFRPPRRCGCPRRGLWPLLAMPRSMLWPTVTGRSGKKASFTTSALPTTWRACVRGSGWPFTMTKSSMKSFSAWTWAKARNRACKRPAFQGHYMGRLPMEKEFPMTNRGRGTVDLSGRTMRWSGDICRQADSVCSSTVS